MTTKIYLQHYIVINYPPTIFNHSIQVKEGTKSLKNDK